MCSLYPGKSHCNSNGTSCGTQCGTIPGCLGTRWGHGTSAAPLLTHRPPCGCLPLAPKCLLCPIPSAPWVYAPSGIFKMGRIFLLMLECQFWNFLMLRGLQRKFNWGTADYMPQEMLVLIWFIYMSVHQGVILGTFYGVVVVVFAKQLEPLLAAKTMKNGLLDVEPSKEWQSICSSTLHLKEHIL